MLVRRPSRPFPSAAVPVLEEPWPIRSGRLALSLGGRDYALGVVEGPEVGRDYQGAPYRVRRVLVLDHGGVRQSVADVTDRDAGHPAVLWAGDLDGDGRLDLVLDESDHYNVTVTALFLSSEAAPGALVRRVARHETTGC